MKPACLPTAGTGCLLALLLAACTPEPPTAPAPSEPPPTTTPPPAPPPQPPPPVPIAGDYELAIRLSSACSDTRLREFFPNRPQKSGIRLYTATISGANPALVRLDGEHLRQDPVWAYGGGFGIVQDQETVSLRTWEGWVPDVMESIAPDAWLLIYIRNGAGEVRADRIEVIWQGRVELVTPEDNWSTSLWERQEQCDAEDHELLFLLRNEAREGAAEAGAAVRGESPPFDGLKENAISDVGQVLGARFAPSIEVDVGRRGAASWHPIVMPASANASTKPAEREGLSVMLPPVVEGPLPSR